MHDRFRHEFVIGSIVNVIDDIAEQTNLLKLNAAREAPRAMEEIEGAADPATDMIQRIASAPEEQSAAGEEISTCVEQIAAERRNRGQQVQSIQAAAGDLTVMAEQLQTAVSWFRIQDGGMGMRTKAGPGTRQSLKIER